MDTPKELEEAFHDFNQNFKKWVPDGIIHIDMEQLCEMGLLNESTLEEKGADDVTYNFNVVETDDKITLFNEKFAVWIVPKTLDDIPTTLTYISLLNKDKPSLELVFATGGIYNAPKFILRILQHFLIEVIDTEEIISSIGKKSG